MSRKKSILTAVVLLLVILVGGMLAYFTDTEVRTNVFTIGDVQITLNEAGWTQDGSTTNYTRTEATNIAPNTTVAKAPTITNDGKNAAYVFIKVQVPVANVTVNGTKANQEIFTLGTKDSAWTEVSHTEATGTYVFAYGTSTTMTSLAKNAITTAVFPDVTLKNLDNPSELGETAPNITVTAYGIQTTDLSASTPSAIFALFGNN